MRSFAAITIASILISGNLAAQDSSLTNSTERQTLPLASDALHQDTNTTNSIERQTSPVIGTAIAQGTPATQLNERSISLQGFYPSQDDYDTGVGAEIQFRSWYNSNIGLAFTAGISSWTINPEEAVFNEGPISMGLLMEGSVDLVPIGGSILMRSAPTPGGNLILETGIRYVSVASDAVASFSAGDSFGNYIQGSDTIDIEDGTVGIISLSLEDRLSSRLLFFVGIGYQFDLDKGHAKWMEEDLGENDLEASYFHVGLSVMI